MNYGGDYLLPVVCQKVVANVSFPPQKKPQDSSFPDTVDRVKQPILTLEERRIRAWKMTEVIQVVDWFPSFD